jgi:SpoVK/Ycf46/Vps4 family AAA+-type ATPase
VFDNAMSRPCVLLLDEFDAIGKMRDDSQEVGEIKRLVNSLLQNLDRLNGDQIVIAATNHHHILDPAVWRRFDVTLHLDKPKKEEIERIISENIPNNNLSKVQIDGISTIAFGLSGSEITTIIYRAVQDNFLLPKEPLSRLILRGVLATKEGAKDAVYYSATIKNLIVATHESSQEKMSIRQIARIVGCSAPYVLEVLDKKEGVTHDHKRQLRRNTTKV